MTTATNRREAAEIDRRTASLLTRCDCEHKRFRHRGATADNNGGNECSGCDCPVFIEKAATAVRP